MAHLLVAINDETGALEYRATGGEWCAVPTHALARALLAAEGRNREEHDLPDIPASPAAREQLLRWTLDPTGSECGDLAGTRDGVVQGHSANARRNCPHPQQR